MVERPTGAVTFLSTDIEGSTIASTMSFGARCDRYRSVVASEACPNCHWITVWRSALTYGRPAPPTGSPWSIY